jgi:membrane associated rhomboid family serine protease
MFPYGDNLVAGARAWAVLALVVLLSLINLPLFLVQPWHAAAVSALAFHPLRFSLHPFVESYTLVLASALHGDIFHLAGNCLFLVVFGRTLERLLGPRLVLGLFPALGVAGFLLHWALYPDSPVPVIGSSGAVAALMGAYLPLFPGARIRMVVFFGWFWKRLTVPAWVFLPYWAGLQLISLALGSQDGVAYAVHAGSFAAGALGAIVWKTSFPFAEEKLAAFSCTSFETV